MSQTTNKGLSRRELGWKALAVTALIKLRSATLFGYAKEPTPATGRGPFYPVDDALPADMDLTLVAGRGERARGEALWLRGRVLGADGEPVPRAEIVIWQTDPAGRYDHPRAPAMLGDGQPYELDPAFQYWGKAPADDEGRYEFRTLVPGYYRLNGRYRPRHVHFRVTAPGYRSLPTEMHWAGDPHAAADFVTDLATHEMLAVEVTAGSDGSEAVFDLVLRPA